MPQQRSLTVFRTKGWSPSPASSRWTRTARYFAGRAGTTDRFPAAPRTASSRSTRPLPGASTRHPRQRSHDDQVNVPCGLIPGASGGGLFVERDGELMLAGIISTVDHNLTYNGLVPLAALRQLLLHPIPYTHDIVASTDTRPRTSTVRS